MGKIIAITNQKGGVGKTTSAINIAAGLGLKGKTVLLVDIDPQGNSTSGVGIDKRTLKLSSYDMLVDGVSAAACVVDTDYQNLSVIPSNIELAAAEIEMIDVNNRETVLKNALKSIKKAYDYSIIDCPPSLGIITANALIAADSYLVPIQCEYYALEGLTQLMNSVRRIQRGMNDDLELEGILLTMYDGRLNLTQQVKEEVEKYFEGKVFENVIPRSVRLSEAPGYGEPIQYYEKNNKGAIAYNNVVEEILKNNE